MLSKNLENSTSNDIFFINFGKKLEFPYISYHDTSEKHMGNVILFVTQIAVLADIAFPLT